MFNLRLPLLSVKLSIFCFCPWLLQAQTALFYQPPVIQLNPLTIVSGPTMFVDMNHDGLADAVYVTSAGDLQVTLHNGSVSPAVSLGSCSPVANYSGVALQFLDLNHDGKADIVFSCGDGRLGIALGNGDGTLQAPTYVTLPSPFALFTLVDMNGDGLADLVAYISSGTHAGSLAIALTAGDGFAAPHYYPVAGAVNALAAGDFNGDGKQDVAATGTEPVYWLGHGDGTLSAPNVLLAESYGYSIATADLNGDGIDDLVTTSATDDAMLVLFGNRSGILGASPDLYPIGEAGGGFVTIADLTGTGRKDVVLSNYEQSTEVYLNDGAGNLSLAGSYLFYGAYYLPQLADFNGDGHLDIVDQTPQSYGDVDGVETSTPGDQYILLGNGNGTFQGAPGSSQQSDLYPQSNGFTAGDWNGDGLLDFATVSYQPPGAAGHLSVLLSRGDGTFTGLDGPTVQFGYPVTADLNRDGKQDVAIIAIYYNEIQVTSCLNSGGGVFTCKPMQLFGTSVSHTNQAAIIADTDGDGIPDLVFEGDTASGGQLYIAKGKGDGTFENEQVTGIALPTISQQSILVADFNNDGHPDLAIYGGSNVGTLILLGAGNNVFNASNSQLAGLPMAVADLNGDGLLDLVTGTPYSLYVNLNTGGGNFDNTASPYYFASTSTYSNSNSPLYSTIGVGDVNGDGLPDILVRAPPPPGSAQDSQLTVLLNAGTGTFTVSPYTYPVGAGYTTTSQVFLGKLNSKATVNGPRDYLDAAVVNAYNLVSELNLKNSQPTEGNTTVISLSTSSNPVASGTTETLTARVTASSGSNVPTGTVTFYQQSLALGTASLNAGSASLSITTAGLAEGDYPIHAIYSGSAAFQGSPSATLNLSVSQKTAPTQTSLASTTPYVDAGSSFLLTAYVAPVAGAGMPTGTVTFVAESAAFPTGLTLGSGSLANGVANFSFPVASGTAFGEYFFTATYNGSSSFAASSSNQVIDQVAVPTKLTITQNYFAGGNAIIQGTAVPLNNACCVTGVVSLYVGTALLQTYSSYQGTFDFSVPVPPSVPAGTYTVTIDFAPAFAYYAPSSLTVPVVVP